MSTNAFESPPPFVALCPNCHFRINPRICYNTPVNFCMPAVPPHPQMIRANNQHHHGEGRPASSPAPARPEKNHPSPSLEPPSRGRPLSSRRSADTSSRPRSSPTKVATPQPSAKGKDRKRRSSSVSTDYLAEFDSISINTELNTALRRTEAQYFPQEATQTLTSRSTSSPSTESSLLPSTSGEPTPLPVGRRWVVFRGRVPGVYSSS